MPNPYYIGQPAAQLRSSLAQDLASIGTSVLPYLTGASDMTAAFSAAAQAAPSGVNSQGGIGGAGITFAPNTTVVVPPGTYAINSLVNTGGADVTWLLADGALIANYQNLNGRVVREGRRTNRATYGIGDFAAGYSIRANAPLEGGAEVMGFTSAQQRQTLNYSTFDSVGLYVDNTATAPIATIAAGGTTYTATSMAFTAALTAAQVAQLRSGMLIGTRHAPGWYGFITAWDPAGLSITVSAWYQMTGSGGGTPANGTGAYVSPITKAWALNANVTLPAGGIGTAAAGFELGILNNQADPGGQGGTPLVWGYDSVNLGTFPCESAFISRGNWYYGFQANGLNNALSTVYGFLNALTYGNSVTANGIGFISSPTLAASTAISNVRHFQASNTALGSGATIAAQEGFHCSALSGATANTGFLSQVAAGAGNRGFWAQGTAMNEFDGPVNLAAAATAPSSGVALGGTTQTTVGATGAASALPANPLGYLIAFLGATKIAIPYYTG